MNLVVVGYNQTEQKLIVWTMLIYSQLFLTWITLHMTYCTDLDGTDISLSHTDTSIYSIRENKKDTILINNQAVHLSDVLSSAIPLGHSSSRMDS